MKRLAHAVIFHQHRSLGQGRADGFQRNRARRLQVGVFRVAHPQVGQRFHQALLAIAGHAAQLHQLRRHQVGGAAFQKLDRAAVPVEFAAQRVHLLHQSALGLARCRKLLGAKCDQVGQAARLRLLHIPEGRLQGPASGSRPSDMRTSAS